MKKSSRFEEFVTVDGNKVKNPTWVGPWPKEGAEIVIGACIYKVGPNGNYVRISPPKQKRNG